jgi:hypothetical protein
VKKKKIFLPTIDCPNFLNRMSRKDGMNMLYYSSVNPLSLILKELKMKTNAKFVVWTLVVVPFVVAIAIFCTSEQSYSAKYKLGPVGWGEINSIRAGTGEGTGCATAQKDCTGSSALLCDCDTINSWGNADPPSVIKYAGDDFQAVGPGSGTMSAQVDNFSKPCSKLVSCVDDGLIENSVCMGGDCSIVTILYNDCQRWKLPTNEPPWETFMAGSCLDP